jgi:kynurenine formamidase
MTSAPGNLATLSAAFRDDLVVDLTLPLAEDLPCTWPGHVPYQHKTFTWFAQQGDGWGSVHNRTGAPYQTRWLCIDEHTGTHLDAPSHFVPRPGSGLPGAGDAGLLGMADVPVTQTAGPAAVVDVSELTGSEDGGRSPRITADRLRRWEDAHGQFRAGEVVLLAGGWDRRYRPGPDGAGYAHAPLVARHGGAWPAPDPGAIDLLRERGVRCVGTDGTSMGPADDGAPTHLAGLGHGMVFVECLAQLDRLPPRGAFFLFLGLRIVDGTGGPGRAIALLPEGG